MRIASLQLMSNNSKMKTGSIRSCQVVIDGACSAQLDHSRLPFCRIYVLQCQEAAPRRHLGRSWGQLGNGKLLGQVTMEMSPLRNEV